MILIRETSNKFVSPEIACTLTVLRRSRNPVDTGHTYKKFIDKFECQSGPHYCFIAGQLRLRVTLSQTLGEYFT